MYRTRKTTGGSRAQIKSLIHGFSLIELLITLSIIGILASICMPRFTGYMIAAHRAQAVNLLTELSTALEQYHMEHSIYDGATLNQLAVDLHRAERYYQFTLATSDNDDYTLTAAPINSQAQRDQHCGTLSIESTGEKHISGDGKLTDCWG